jgi:peptide deformylase
VAVRPVLRLPAPALKAVARPAGDAVAAAATAADLVDTMRARDHCVGLAAPQIGGRPARVLRRRHRPPQGPLLRRAGGAARPGAGGHRRPGGGPRGLHERARPDRQPGRPATVAVQGTTPEGATRLVEADAIEARALLHELDHLDGLLFLDRVVSASTDLFRRRRYR